MGEMLPTRWEFLWVAVLVAGFLFGIADLGFGEGHSYAGNISTGLQKPTSVSGNAYYLYVLDSSKQTIEKFNYTGSYAGYFSIGNPQNPSNWTGLAVDSSGNAYITGESKGANGESDFTTIKYGPGGKMNWVQKFSDSSSNNPKNTTGIAVDSQGNAYVTGETKLNGSDDFSFATVKYDSTGKQTWVTYYSGSNWDQTTLNPKGVAVDSSGNAYVTGDMARDNSSSDNDFATIKYDPSGKKQWIRRYHGPSSNSIAVNNKTGNFYTIDPKKYPTPIINYYDQYGNSLGYWDKVSGYFPFTSPSGIYVAEDGKVYIADSGAKSIEIFNSGGQNESAPASQVPWYPGSSIFLSGLENPTAVSGNQDYLYVYDHYYQTINPYLYNGTPATGVNRIPVGDPNHPSTWNSMAVDSKGNAYLTGNIYHSSGEVDFSTVKYDSSGKLIWTRRYNGPDKVLNRPSGVAVDSSGNAYVTGTGESESTSGLFDFATVKYDSSGRQLWVQRYSGPARSNDSPAGIAVDSQGNAYQTGSWKNSNGQSEFATVKYDSSGKQLWVKRYNGPQTSSMTADQNTGNFFVVNSGETSSPSVDYYDSSGNSLGSNYTASNGIQFNSPQGIYSAPNGSLYLLDSGMKTIHIFSNHSVKPFGAIYVYSNTIQTGLLGPRGVTGNANYLYILDAYQRSIYKYHYNGVKVSDFYGITLNDPTNMYNFSGIAVDLSGNIYYTNTNSHQIHKFDSVGNPLKTWSTGNGTFPKGLTIDSVGYLYCTNPGTHHIFKYDSSGVMQSNWNPTQLVNLPNGIAVDSSGNVYVTGGTNSNTIYRYNSTGSTLDTVYLGNSNNNFQGITVDRSGYLYVVDKGPSTPNVKIFDSEGNLYQTVETGSGVTPLKDPWGIFLSETGYLYVANDDVQGGVFVYVPSENAVGTQTPTPIATNTYTPTNTHTPTITSTPTFTASPIISNPSDTPTPTPTYSLTPENLLTPTFTATETPISVTPSVIPTSTNTPRPGNHAPKVNVLPSVNYALIQGATQLLTLIVSDADGDPFDLYFSPEAPVRLLSQAVILGKLNRVYELTAQRIGDLVFFVFAYDNSDLTQVEIHLNVSPIETYTPTALPIVTPTSTPTPTPVPPVDELILAQGSGGTTLVNVRNMDPQVGKVFTIIRSFRGIPAAFLEKIGGGSGRATFLSTGDVNADGQVDFVLTFGPAQFPTLFPNLVLPLDGNTLRVIGHNFFAFPVGSGTPVNYNVGELRSAVGNFFGGESQLIAVAQGAGGNGVVRIYQYTGKPAPNGWAVVSQFDGLTGDAKLGNAGGGINLAAGDLNNDGKAELLIAQTNSSLSQTMFQVVEFSPIGKILSRVGFTAFNLRFRGNGGIELVAADLNGDHWKEIVVAGMGNSRNFGDDRDNTPINLIGVIRPILTDGKLTGFQRADGTSVLSVWSEAINPSGAVNLTAGELDGNSANGDELVVGTGILRIWDGTAMVESQPAPQSKFRVVKIGYNGSKVTGITNLFSGTGGVDAFVGANNPSSGMVFLSTGNLYK